MIEEAKRRKKETFEIGEVVLVECSILYKTFKTAYYLATVQQIIKDPKTNREYVKVNYDVGGSEGVLSDYVFKYRDPIPDDERFNVLELD